MNKVPLSPNAYYQFSQKINGSLLFQSHDDYLHFLFLYCRHVQPLARTFAYCLLPDSFYVVLQICDLSSLLRHTERVGTGTEELADDCAGYLNKKVSEFVTSYHTSLPSFEGITSLASTGWRCELIPGETEAPHRLGLLHLYPLYFQDYPAGGLWPYTSLHSLQSRRHTFLDRDKVYEWFGGYEAFLKESRFILAESY